MTLIAAFPCARSTALICADSQEIEGHYRRTLQKIKPKACGSFDLTIGGSGRGRVIDAFVHRIETATVASRASSVEEWKSLFDLELKKFHRDKRNAYSKDERQMAAIICAYHKPSQRFGLWSMEGDELIPITGEPKLVGWNEKLYEHEATRLYKEGMSVTQAIFLALRVLTLGQSTSHYIREPFTFIVASNSGLSQVSPERIKELEEQATLFNAQLDSIMLACPDITVRPDDFERRFEEFRQTTKQLRQDYLEEKVKKTFPNAAALLDIMQNTRRDAFADFPKGISFIMNENGSVGYQIQTPEEMAQQRWMFEIAKQHKEADEEFKRLIEGRGEPIFSEVRQVFLRGRPS